MFNTERTVRKRQEGFRYHHRFSLLMLMMTILITLLVLTTNHSAYAWNEYGKEYPVHDSDMYETNVSKTDPYPVAWAVRFSNDTKGMFSVSSKEYTSSSQQQRWTDTNSKLILGEYCVKLSSVEYTANSTIRFIMTYYMGVFNVVPKTIECMLKKGNLYITMPNRVRKSYSVEYVNNTIDSLTYDNNQQICFMVMGDYVIQELQVPSWVDISYPQVVDYSLNQTLSHTLTVYYYDWYAEVINKPHRYFFDHVLSSQQVSLPNESDALLYRFNIVGASGQTPSAPSYPGTGLVNFEFSFNASAGFLDVNGQPVDIDVETLSCAYEKKDSNSLSLKDGTSQVDLQKQVLQCRWYGASDMDLVSIGLVASRKTLPPKPTPTPSTSPTPTNKDTETIIIAVSASVGGTVLLLVIGCVALSMAYYLFIKKRKAKYQNLY